ncbi:coiled-coil domain-containing protein 191 isoform X2 [Rhea pennata]|uniref:coiled-coil domain-containing protein 191 isoform X2 n=1 Tax=Rhea pennata TaxID=8795 RepID=UPI002E254466
MAFSGHRPELFRWRRLTAEAGTTPKFDSDNVEHWIKRVDQASEYAVSEAFSFQKPSYLQGFCGPVMNLESMEQLQDHDEAYEEAQELLSNWIKSKLQLELTSDGEEEVGSVLLEEPSAVFLKYQRFDDLCSYLEHELESSSVQEYLKHLLQSKVVDCGIVEDLRIEDTKKKQKPADPRITMKLRHKQVKENRMKYQKALELQRQEKALKKSVLFEAKQQAQEEDRRKALQAKQEENAIQREMVKLRKEMAEKRHIMAEAWRMERKRQEKSQKLSMQEVFVTVPLLLDLKKEEQGEEKQRKVQELLSRIQTDNQKCLQRHFSAWFKLILEHRIKMGKARAFADWKCQLKALQAWRNYNWAQKVERETQQLEVHLQDQNRKKQLSVEHNQRRLLHPCFLAWQRWSQGEAEKRELQIKRGETKKKMAQLLEAVSLGKDCQDEPPEVGKTGTAKMSQNQPLQQEKSTETCFIQEDPDHARDHSCWDASYAPHPHSYRKPKFAWQITRKHATLSAQDRAVCRNQIATVPQQFQAPSPKTALAYGSCFEHRHAFQQQLIEKQRRQLQEQQELILELQENQRLNRAKEEAAQATAVTLALNNPVSQTREKSLKRRKQFNCKNVIPVSPPVSNGPENTMAVTQSRRPSSQLTSAHPILKAMEERAIQRAERRRKLEEAKQQREEEKLKELEKQRRLEKVQQLQKRAKDHYEKVLLRKLGLLPWKRLREEAKENLVVAERHHCLSLQRKCLMTWLQHTQESLMEKASRAGDFYSLTLLRMGFRNWLKYKDYFSTLEERMSNLHAAYLKKKYFWAWFDLVMEEKSTLWEKLKIATKHSNKRLMLSTFQAWRQYPLLMKKEREKEERKNQLRRRVAEILPDFQT